MSENIQTYCKNFRENVLGKTLDDIHDITGVNIKTLSAFEHSRSSNIKHLEHYIKACDTENQVHVFNLGLLVELNKIMKDSDYRDR